MKEKQEKMGEFSGFLRIFRGFFGNFWGILGNFRGGPRSPSTGSTGSPQASSGLERGDRRDSFECLVLSFKLRDED